MSEDPAGEVPVAGREVLAGALVDEGDRLYAFALRVTRDPDLAADAVQEAFASALERLDGFRRESTLGTWLHRIVYTKSIDLLRRRGREAQLGNDDDSREASGGEVELGRGGAWSRPPDAILLGVETRKALEQALGKLTPLQRAVFELKLTEGRPTSEVAAILEMPAGTVRVHLHRARLRLRRLLGGHFSGGGS